MPLEWAVIVTAVVPHIKKYVADKISKSADAAISQLYHRLAPAKLQKLVESFVAVFVKELKSTADNLTLTSQSYHDALNVFLADPDVLEALQKPLDLQSELDLDLLQRRWTYLLDAKGQHLIDLPKEFAWDDVATLYAKSVQKQVVADPELRQVAEVLAVLQTAKEAKRGADAAERIAGPAKRFDLARYAQSIREAYSFLRFGSLDSDWTVYEGRVSLEHVYVPQSVKQALPPRDLTRDYIKELKTRRSELLEEVEIQKREYEALRPVPVLEVVDNPAYNRLVILGDPGLGKSTLLKYLALRWAHQQNRALALLLELRRTVHESGEIDFLNYIERGAGQTLPLPRTDLDRYLRENDSLLLFDALDEVIEGRRGDVVLRILAFAREYPKARVIVTTRIHGYHPGSTHPEQFRDAEFQQFTLQDFTPEEVDRFVEIWHKEAFQHLSDRAKYESRLRNALQDSPAIRELSANPLLLTMMAVLNRVQDLPRDRGKLYERCAELLLKNWDLEKFEELKEKKEAQDIKDKLGPDQKMRILELVAAAMQEERTGLAGNIIGEEKLREIIQKQLTELGVPQSWSVASDLIWMLRERNFMLAHLGDRQYAFVHRTFLEYFCARDLNYSLTKTNTLPIDQLALRFRQYWRPDEWQEVLCLLCGMIGPEHASQCISELLAEKNTNGGDKAVFLAARCLLEIREQGKIKGVRGEVHKALSKLVTFDFPYSYSRFNEEADEVRRIRTTAVEELARGWKDSPETLPWLKYRARSDENWAVRQTAVQELARGWKDDQETLPLLKDRARSDENPGVRQAAVRELARGWKDDAETLLLLKDRATYDEKEYVRRAAVQELARGWKDAQGTLPWLKGRVLSDDHWAVRQAAVQELVRGWKDDQETLILLKDRARSDESWVVRQTVLRELARGWKDTPEILPLLKNRARYDEDEYVRRAVVQELEWGWKDDPEVAAFLVYSRA